MENRPAHPTKNSEEFLPPSGEEGGGGGGVGIPPDMQANTLQRLCTTPCKVDRLAAPCFNSPFYSCVLSDLVLAESEAGVDLVLIQTSLLFVCRSCCSYANYFAFTYQKN